MENLGTLVSKQTGSKYDIVALMAPAFVATRPLRDGNVRVRIEVNFSTVKNPEGFLNDLAEALDDYGWSGVKDDHISKVVVGEMVADAVSEATEAIMAFVTAPETAAAAGAIGQDACTALGLRMVSPQTGSEYRIVGIGNGAVVAYRKTGDRIRVRVQATDSNPSARRQLLESLSLSGFSPVKSDDHRSCTVPTSYEKETITTALKALAA